jgi:flagella basal body P-ring formation protein FlgA
MRQAANSLLTLHPFSPEARPSVRVLPRDSARMEGPLLNPFFTSLEGSPRRVEALPVLSNSPRSSVYPRLGEGSVRRLLQSIIPMSVLLCLGLLSGGLWAQTDGLPEGKLKGQFPQPDEIVAALKAHIVGTTSFEESEIELRLLTDLSSVELPSGNISYRVTQSFALPNYRNLQMPIEASLDGKFLRTFFVSAEATIRAEVVQAARRIPYGKTLASDDLKVGITEIQHPKLNYLRSCDEVLGKIARHSLSAGVPLTREDIANPVLVRSGEIVHLRLEKDGIRLALLGRAEQSGQLGQYIRVKNLDFSKTIKVRVIGRGEALVE